MGAITFSCDSQLIVALQRQLKLSVFVETCTFKADTTVPVIATVWSGYEELMKGVDENVRIGRRCTIVGSVNITIGSNVHIDGLD